MPENKHETSAAAAAAATTAATANAHAHANASTSANQQLMNPSYQRSTSSIYHLLQAPSGQHMVNGPPLLAALPQANQMGPLPQQHTPLQSYQGTTNITNNNNTNNNNNSTMRLHEYHYGQAQQHPSHSGPTDGHPITRNDYERIPIQRQIDQMQYQHLRPILPAIASAAASATNHVPLPNFHHHHQQPQQQQQQQQHPRLLRTNSPVNILMNTPTPSASPSLSNLGLLPLLAQARLERTQSSIPSFAYQPTPSATSTTTAQVNGKANTSNEKAKRFNSLQNPPTAGKKTAKSQNVQEKNSPPPPPTSSRSSVSPPTRRNTQEILAKSIAEKYLNNPISEYASIVRNAEIAVLNMDAQTNSKASFFTKGRTE